MLRDLFSDWAAGKLGARRFAVLYGVLIAGLIGFFALAGTLAMFTVGRPHASSHTVGSFAGLLVLALLLLFAGLFNIVIKRGRDIGIPGYIAGIGFLIVFFMGGLGIFLSIALALIPSDTVVRAQT
jgi:hypothetical protein